MTDKEYKGLMEVAVQKMKELDKLLKPIGTRVVMVNSEVSVTPIEYAEDIESRRLNNGRQEND